MINVKFFFLNSLKIKCNNVQERAFFLNHYSHTVTLSLQNIWKEKLHIDQKYLIEQFEIFH